MQRSELGSIVHTSCVPGDEDQVKAGYALSELLGEFKGTFVGTARAAQPDGCTAEKPSPIGEVRDNLAIRGGPST